MRRWSNFTPTRRQFLNSAAAAVAVAQLPAKLRGQESKSPIAKLAADPMRPQFHLMPAKNWMNDPNGPIFCNGKYHMFFQYNPLAATWGDMSWYHSSSPDMIHWQSLPVAFTPTPGGPDSFGCFSGSALQVGKSVYQIYTGTQKSGSDKATIRDGQNNVQETQCLAYSDDPELVKWIKLPQPVIPLPPPGIAVTGFRDPSVWRQGDWYYMTVGSGEADVGGCVLLYRSKAPGDLTRWEYMHKLTSGEWNGKKTANPCDDGEMWECPDLFALDGAHVLIYSTLGKVFWQSGDLDPTTMKFSAKNSGELDLDAFYAPKTQLDAKGRRILWGWIPERRSEEAMRQAGWSGMMSLPRVLQLDKNGALRITSLPELTRLRASPMDDLPAISPHGYSLKLRKARGEVLFTSSTDRRPFELIFTDLRNRKELLRATYSPEERTIEADGKRIAMKPGDSTRLHAYIDGSVIELLVNERIGYTKRFYYEGTIAPDIEVTLESHTDLRAGLKGWDITPISQDRLSTPAPAA